MWSLTKNLCPDNVWAKAPLSSKKKLLEALSNQLAPDQDDVAKAHLFQGLLHREKLGSTGIGRGIAIPHGRFDNIDQPCLAIITTETAIEFDSPDKQPVDLFIGLAVPTQADNAHLNLLAQLTELLRQPEFCQTLRESESNEALYNTILMATVMHNEHDQTSG